MTLRENPFVGLRPFEAEDALYYFGRGEQSQALLNRLRETRFLAVVGSSGSGKSSLVRAGLIPNLEAGFLARSRDTWHIARMKPGDRPVFNLAQALLETMNCQDSSTGSDDWYEAIRIKGFKGVKEQIGPVLERGKSNLFLLVDQFEEVFRFGLHSNDTKKQEQAAEFVDLLLRLADQDEVPVYVCLTMRTDYIGDCDAFHGLPEAMNRSQYLVPRLTRAQRREVIEGPIRLAGASISTRLLDRLLNESGQFRDDLPVLQHALMRTWEKWQYDPSRGSTIDISHYEEIGTMKNALSNHADEALVELSKEDQQQAKRLFQALTETDLENRAIRRPAHLSQLEAVTNASGNKLRLIIDKFRQHDRAFLVLSPDDDNPLVDISHESLMRQWDTLKEWIEEEAGQADTYRRLADAAELYRKGKGGLYTDPALQAALDWLTDQVPTRAWAEQYHQGFDRAKEFLDKSREDRDKKKLAEKRQQEEREQLLKEKNRRIITAVAAVVIAILAVLIVFAVNQNEKMRKQKIKAAMELQKRMAYEWAAYSIAVLKKDSNHDLSFRLAERAYYAEKTNLVAYRALLSVFYDGKFYDEVFDNRGNEFSQILSEKSDFFAAFSPNEERILTVTSREAILWNLDGNRDAGGEFTLEGDLEFRPNAAFSADGKYIVCCTKSDEKVLIIDLLKKKMKPLELVGGVYSVALSPDINNKTIITASRDKKIRQFDLTGKLIKTFTGHTDHINSVAFSEDGKYIVSASWDKTVRRWDLNGNQVGTPFRDNEAGVNSAAFSPDGQLIVTASADGIVRLWDIESGEGRILAAHKRAAVSVRFSPDGKYVLTASEDKSVRLLRLNNFLVIEFEEFNNIIQSASFSPDGKYILIVPAHGPAQLRLIDAEEIIRLVNEKGNVRRLTDNEKKTYNLESI